jgi:uncharacterized SAM-binding protein YcdF (DUF218 family)
MRMPFKGPCRRVSAWVVAVLVVVASVTVGRTVLLRAAAAFLVVEDPLQPAAAIVVLGGGTPFRALEAAALYRAGWAPRVVLTRPADDQKQRALHSLGISSTEEWEVNRAVLLRVGVPASAIDVVSDQVGDTLEELRTVHRAMGGEFARIILVTSKVHTRRVRLIWQRLGAPRPAAILRAARLDAFEPTDWWSERASAQAVLHEYLGIANYVLGSPVARRGDVPPAVDGDHLNALPASVFRRPASHIVLQAPLRW